MSALWLFLVISGAAAVLAIAGITMETIIRRREQKAARWFADRVDTEEPRRRRALETVSRTGDRR